MTDRGYTKVGVFSTRSPHRPNPVGLSLAAIDRVDMQARRGLEQFRPPANRSKPF
jgi:tRNA (Thr-GGU) A37 N-methylase